MFPKIGVPPKHPKMIILVVGYHHFWKHPYICFNLYVYKSPGGCLAHACGQELQQISTGFPCGSCDGIRSRVRCPTVSVLLRVYRGWNPSQLCGDFNNTAIMISVKLSHVRFSGNMHDSQRPLKRYCPKIVDEIKPCKNQEVFSERPWN